MLIRSTANIQSSSNVCATMPSSPQLPNAGERLKQPERERLTKTVEGGVITDCGIQIHCLPSAAHQSSTEALSVNEFALVCDHGDMEVPSSSSTSTDSYLSNTDQNFSRESSHCCFQSAFLPIKSQVLGRGRSFRDKPSRGVEDDSKSSQSHETEEKSLSGGRQTTVSTQSQTSKSAKSHSTYSQPKYPRAIKLQSSSFQRQNQFGKDLERMLVPPARPKTLQIEVEPSSPRILDVEPPNYQLNKFIGSYSASVTGTIIRFLHEIDHCSPYLESQKPEKKTLLHDISEQDPVPKDQVIRKDDRPDPIIFTSKLHRPELDKIININVGGEDYFVRYGVLKQHPDTLLGSDELFNYYLPALQCFFFDRNRTLFEFILQYYQTGVLEIPTAYAIANKETKSSTNHTFTKISHLLKLELDFFKIEYEMSCMVETKQQETVAQTAEQQRQEARYMLQGLEPELSRWVSRKLSLYLFLTNPQSSIWSAAWMVMDYIFVLCSVLILFLESEERFRQAVANGKTVYADIVAVLQGVTQAFFSIDFALRLLAWPSRSTINGVRTFLGNGNNVCDLISLMPFYLPQLISLLDNRDVKSLVVLRVIRTLRITRIFRIVRHSSRLQFIFEFLLCNNVWDLLILAELFFLFVILFGSILYFLESGNPGVFSIPSAMWWAVVTLTGIGYGDLVPTSTLGRCAAALAIMCGMIFLALPLSIILHQFAKYMKSRGLSVWSGMEQGRQHEDTKEKLQKLNHI